MPSPITTALPQGSPPLPADQRPFQPAGFLIRLCAHAIDTVIMCAILFPILIVLLWDRVMAQARSGIVSSTAIDIPMSFHVLLNIPPIIAVILLWRWRSATPGKMLCGVKIVDAGTLGKPTWLQCVLRILGYIPPMIPITFISLPLMAPLGWSPGIAALVTSPLLLGFLSIAWDPRTQGWHDKLAGTLVIRKNSL